MARPAAVRVRFTWDERGVVQTAEEVWRRVAALFCPSCGQHGTLYHFAGSHVCASCSGWHEITTVKIEGNSAATHVLETILAAHERAE